jgi:hypothetical protein
MKVKEREGEGKCDSVKEKERGKQPKNVWQKLSLIWFIDGTQEEETKVMNDKNDKL